MPKTPENNPHEAEELFFSAPADAAKFKPKPTGLLSQADEEALTEAIDELIARTAP